MKTVIRTILSAACFLTLVSGALAQTSLVATPAVSGHEQALGAIIRERLKNLAPQTDNLGNLWVTAGSGSPHRLIVTSIDEPGYVVSAITEDGYLRVQRLPQSPPNAVFDALHFAQPVWVTTRAGKQVNGVFAGLSVHLSPARVNPPKMTHPDEMYVDIGAKSADEVRAAGVDLLDTVALQRSNFPVGNSAWAGPASGDRARCETLLKLAINLKASKAQGTTTIAFVTEQWIGGRGLNRLLTELHPDEMIFVGRAVPATPADKDAKPVEELKSGTGLALGLLAESNQTTDALAPALKLFAQKQQIALQTFSALPPRIVSYVKGASLPGNLVVLGIPVLWPATPAETVAWNDAGKLQGLLEAYLDISGHSDRGEGGDALSGESPTLQAFVQAYGASGHEENVRKVILSRLPPWAASKTTTDSSGNLVLHLANGRHDDKTPSMAFVAHMDEIGYQVSKIEDDGRLQVDVLGGGYTQYFLGHVALIHKKDGTDIGGVLEPPDGWNKPNFEWPSGSRAMDEPAHAYVGTQTKAETEKLGIAIGDYMTVPKQYRPLLTTRANARSFDDRVGCTALVAAVNALGPDLPGRDVTFVWSTEEEVGLKGAAAFAEQAAKEGHAPDFVFAIDTFVSSDSPLESKRFADAEIGKGFVVRAVDNSNVVPSPFVDRVVALAKENNIPVQYGVTGGGNDGSVFLRYGSVDIALGWPLRYAHSPAEVIDTKDVDSLGKIITVLARKW